MKIIFLILMPFIVHTQNLPLFDDNAWTPADASETLLLQFDPNDPPTSSAWNDQSDNNKDISFFNTPTTGTVNGNTTIILDGINQYGQTGAYASLQQPLTIYLAIKVLTYAADKTIIDGSNGGVGNQCRWYMTGDSPKYSFYGGAGLASFNTDLTDGWHIVRIIHNGASSSTRLDENSPLAGDAGANNMSQFLLGRYGYGAGQYPNIEIACILVYAGSVSAGTDTKAMKYINGFIQ